MRFVFFGTSLFGAIILKRLLRAQRTPSLVITTPEKPAGRQQRPLPSPVKTVAESLNLPVIQPESFTPEIIENLKSLEPEYFIVASYGKILPKKVLDIPKKASLNVHASLLPKYRGASPIQSALLQGEVETGVSIMQMDEKMDHGPIYMSRKILIPPHADFPMLESLLANEGGKLLLELLSKMEREYLEPWPQQEQEATYTGLISRDQGKIDWSEPAKEIERKVRALYPWPGTYAFAGEKRVKILKASYMPFTPGSPRNGIGKTYLAPNERIAVQTGRDYLIIEILQMEGKKPVTSEDFLRGHKEFIGTVLT